MTNGSIPLTEAQKGVAESAKELLQNISFNKEEIIDNLGMIIQYGLPAEPRQKSIALGVWNEYKVNSERIFDVLSAFFKSLGR